MEIIRALGKGPGYVLLAAFIATGLFVLAWYNRDVASLTGPLGALVVAVYGGGAAKSIVKNGKK